MSERTIFIYDPVGLDLWENRHAGRLAKGQRVIKVQPHGVPANGTLGHCFIADAETEEFIGLVLENSLVKQRLGRAR